MIMVYSMFRNGSGAYNHVHENFVGIGRLKETNGLLTVGHQRTEQEICSRLTVAVMPWCDYALYLPLYYYQDRYQVRKGCQWLSFMHTLSLL